MKSATIALELDLPHAPEKVWRALTEPKLLSQWLLPVVGEKLDLAAGAAFTLQAPPQPSWDGTVSCELLEVEPRKKLRYRWVVGDERGIDTVVTFTLTPTATGTRLSLVHDGFKLPEQKGAMGGSRYGWEMMLQTRLVELLPRI